jgi:hypothetical protein
VSLAVENAGLVDAYRVVHPDPAADEGLTWPASRPKVGSYNPGPAGKPADRIDLAYVSEGIAVTNSEVVGEEGATATDVPISPWPGDHRAVVSTLDIPLAESGPYAAPAQRLVDRGDSVVLNVFATPAPRTVTLTLDSESTPTSGSSQVYIGSEDVDEAGVATIDTEPMVPGHYSIVAEGEGTPAVGELWVREPGAGPTLAIGQSSYAVGEPIDVSWVDAPGNKWDWIGVYKRGADPDVAYYKLWAYTDAAVAGQMVIDDGFHGGAWPLGPGEYDVLLLEDDSYQELARAPLSVKR